MRKAEIEQSRRQSQLERTQTKQSVWETEWGAAIAEIGLHEESWPESVNLKVDVLKHITGCYVDRFEGWYGPKARGFPSRYAGGCSLRLPNSAAQPVRRPPGSTPP